MRIYARLWLGLAACLLIGSIVDIGSAKAAQDCPAGRTLSGECANPDAVDDLRLSAILLAQQKLSQTAPPVLPSSDPDHPVLRDPGETAKLDRYLAPAGRGGRP